MAREDPRSAAAAMGAAAVLFVGRAYHESLAVLGDAATRATLWRAHQDAVRLGWDQDARSALERGAALEPREPRWREALLALHARRRDYAPAARHGEALLALAPRAASAMIELAAITLARGERAAACARIDAALALTPESAPEPLRLEAARLYRAAGAFARAGELLDALGEAAGPLAPTARAMRAELALWEGDHDAAAAIARTLEGQPGGARVRAVVALARGDRAGARALFEEALRLDEDDSECHAWLAELDADEQRFDAAHAHTSRAVSSAHGPLFVAHLLRLRINLRESGTSQPLLRAYTEHLRPTLAALCPPALAQRLPSGDRDAWRQAIDLALVEMRDNRSVVPTVRTERGLALLATLPEPRAEARRVLESIRTGSSARAIEELVALGERFPYSGLPAAHRGELLLWMGDVPAARAALEEALAVVMGTRWAHIGLALCDVLEGAPERALATSARGVKFMGDADGPAVFVHRGEAYLALGRLSEAEADLTRAVTLHPGRVGAWVLLGRLRHRQGRPEAVRAAADVLLRLAPGLLSDAARAEHVELFLSPTTLADGHLGAVLARAHSMMRGNRSSSCSTFFSPEGALRFGAHGGHVVERLHGDDGARLAEVEALLRRFG